MRLRRRAGLVLSLGALFWASSCSSLGPDTAAASAVAVAFHQALSSSDGAAACALLAPETAAELTTSADSECAASIVTQDFPEATTVQSSQAFGRSAQVVMDDDVLFLSIFDGQWLVTAAGCQSRSERPYDCQVKGG